MAKRKTTRTQASPKRGHSNGESGKWPAQSTAISDATLRRRLRSQIQGLSNGRLRVAEDFLSYLEERESNEATEELLRIPGILGQLRIAEREIRKGKTVNWRTIRRDV